MDVVDRIMYFHHCRSEDIIVHFSMLINWENRIDSFSSFMNSWTSQFMNEEMRQFCWQEMNDKWENSVIYRRKYLSYFQRYDDVASRLLLYNQV
jgi:hypothetical protein